MIRSLRRPLFGRRHPRVETDLLATRHALGRASAVRVRDLSLGGAFVVLPPRPADQAARDTGRSPQASAPTEAPPAVLHLALRLPGDDEPLRLSARVVRDETFGGRRGLALAFDALSDRAFRSLAAFIARGAAVALPSAAR